MPAKRELSLFTDLDQGRLVQSFLSTLQATLPRFVFGDSIPVSFRPLKSNGNNSVHPWSEVGLTGKTVRIAIGNPAGAASSGTFTLTYGANTTAAIAYNADGAAIQTALNALASITAAGGVVVTRATTGAFRIVFNTAGARTVITADAAAIYPTAGVEIHVSVEGDGSTREIIVARLEALPAAYAELTDDFPVAAAEIVEVRNGVVPVTAADAVKASGILDATVIGDGDNFTVGAISFSMVVSASTAVEIEVGSSDAEKAANIISKVNAHSTVLTTAVVGSPPSAIVFLAKTAGVGGNSIITPFFFAHTTLTGGLDAVAGIVGISEIKSLGFSVLPYSGFYALEIDSEQTLGIPWDADAPTLQAALKLLSSIGSGMVIVSGEFPSFTINFDSSLGDIGPMTIDITGLIVPKGRAGSLNTNTAAMIELLNGSSQATAKLEVELYDIATATTWTVLQTDCVVIDDVIGNTPSTTPAFPSVMELIDGKVSKIGEVLAIPDTVAKRDSDGALAATAIKIASGNFAGNLIVPSGLTVDRSWNFPDASISISGEINIQGAFESDGVTVIGGDFSTSSDTQFACAGPVIIRSLGAVDVTLPASGTLATQAYANALVVGLLDDRGNYNASGNVFPSSGGSGIAGAILKGDLWTISVAGTLGGSVVTAGDVIRAKSDAPGQTAGNWVITENNLGYVPQNTAGTLALAGFPSITGTLADVNIASAATWNAKESPLTFSSPLSRSTNTISIPAATTSVSGYLTSTDWNTFNNKGSGTVTSVGFTGGIISVATGTTTPAFTVAGTSGGIPYFSSASTWATSAALAANALVVGGGAGVAPSTVTTGTGVLAALGTNVGSAGAPVLFNGALGTPTSGTLTNCTFPTLNQNTSGTAAGLSAVLSGASGGTGVANTSKTITLGASFTTTGTDIPTFAFPSVATARTYTFPTTTATLARTDATQNFSGPQNINLVRIGNAAEEIDTVSGGRLQIGKNQGAIVGGAGTTTNVNGTVVMPGTLSVTGDVQFAKTITAAGTTGAQTINKTSGSVNFAAAATSLVVTNSLCTASSVIQCTVGSNDTTMFAARAVAGAGSFTIYSNAAATAECRVNFTLTN